MMKTLLAATALGLVAGGALAQENPMVGGAAMPATNDIVTNAMASADHTTLVAAVSAAGLVETLQGAGPFTVFAPTNDAFAALPAGSVDELLLPENLARLQHPIGLAGERPARLVPTLAHEQRALLGFDALQPQQLLAHSPRAVDVGGHEGAADELRWLDM